MRPVKREEILDYITYTEKRSELQSSVLKPVSYTHLTLPTNREV